MNKWVKYASAIFSEDSLEMILIRNIVTNIIAKSYTPLQIALAVLILQNSTAIMLLVSTTNNCASVHL